MKHRWPLRELAQNSPAVKRPKVSVPFYQQLQAQEEVQQQQRELEREGERQAERERENEKEREREKEKQRSDIPLSEWQRRWRSIMCDSVIYFDVNDPSVQDNGSKYREKELASSLFERVGASIQAFFDSKVTVVVSNRPKSELPQKFFLHSTSLKFWNYEKVFRFLKNLGEVPDPDAAKQRPQQHLSTLLKDEKIYGAQDRDPLAKRDDFNYFKHPYFYVYDLRQVIKPVALREWKMHGDKKPWPFLHHSSYGHSLFTPDAPNANDERKRERRRIRDLQNKPHRDRLRAIYSRHQRYTATSSSSPEKISPRAQMPPPFQLQYNGGVTSSILPPSLTRQASAVTNRFIESHKRDGFEIEASGYAGGSTAQSAELTKNGLVAPKSTVASKQINHLQRKLIEKRSKLTTAEVHDINNEKPKVPGYCENCRIHFNDFDEHCSGLQHRSFAEDDDNFASIDAVIRDLDVVVGRKR